MRVKLHLLYVLVAVLTIVGNAASISNRSTSLFGHDVGHLSVGKLPGIHFELPRSWAGEVAVPETLDSSLFFWLFEADHEADCDKLIIWLNGGPGCSSLQGLTFENGPLEFPNNATHPMANRYSWTKFANVLWIDQPVGTGFSTGSNQALNNTQVTEQFYAWLKAFYGHFPGLISKKTYFMGESYAGIYIPYFTQAILANRKELPINLQSIGIGNPAFGEFATMMDISVTTYLHQQNHMLHIPPDVLEVFDNANSNCKYDRVLSRLGYPPAGKTALPLNPPDPHVQTSNATCDALGLPTTAAQVNASIYSQCFAGETCATWFTANNYLNATRPCSDVYNINHNCRTRTHTEGIIAYFNKPAVKAAIHAPNKTIVACNETVLRTLSPEDIGAPAHSIIPKILEQGIAVHIYSGDYDLLLNHIGTALVIQNMTWGSKQGMQFPPTNTFYANGKPAGNWGYERNLSYHHFFKSGHQVPHDRPAAAFAFVRDFVVGNAGYHV